MFGPVWRIPHTVRTLITAYLGQNPSIRFRRHDSSLTLIGRSHKASFLRSCKGIGEFAVDARDSGGVTIGSEMQCQPGANLLAKG